MVAEGKVKKPVKGKTMAEHIEKGKKGEELAYKYLLSNGYSILERNWRYKHLEIDIIAKKNNVLHFIEVKTRKEKGLLSARESMSFKKKQNIMRAIEIYLNIHKLQYSAQLDLIAITIDHKEEMTLEHIKNCSE